jgi:hypothetical protein
VWRLTPRYDPNTLTTYYDLPQTPWVGSVTPFVLHTVKQFHPAPAPSLHSPKWVEQFSEVRDFGGSTNTNAEQIGTARFWSANVILQYNQLGRELARERGLGVVETARWLAILNMVGADAQIAVMHWKYEFLFWRPVTAIDPCSVTNDGFGPPACDPADLDTDNNPATLEHVGWRPLLSTPNHPEYPGAHGSIIGAMAEVLTWFRGTDQIDVDIPGTAALAAVRHFETAEELLEEIVNARVWAGLHYRGSTEAGVKLGQKGGPFRSGARVRARAIAAFGADSPGHASCAARDPARHPSRCRRHEAATSSRARTWPPQRAVFPSASRLARRRYAPGTP